MYMLILLGFWMLVNYVYVDSNEFYNTCKLCICWFQWIIILGNYVYVDSTGFLNACKLCVDSTDFECL